MQLLKYGNSIMTYTVNSEIFVSHMRSFVKITSSRNGQITLLFTDISKSCPKSQFFTSQICHSTFFVKIKFSGKFPNFQ